MEWRSIIKNSAILGVCGLLCVAGLSAQTLSLPYNPVTAEYSNSLDRIILISASPDQLHIYDPASNTDTAVNLPKPPLSLSVSLDGTHAAVGHDALISYVNLQTPSLEKTLATQGNVTNLALGNDYVYILTYGGGTQWVQISTGATGSYGVYEGSVGRLHPSGTALYTVGDGSTGVLTDLNVSTGPVTGQNTGPYFGDYPVRGGIWFSPDGSRVYVGSAMAYQANPQDATLSHYISPSGPLDTKADGLYWTSFSGVSLFRSLTESEVLGRIAIIPSAYGGPQPDGKVLLYDSAYIEPAGILHLPLFTVNGSSYAAHGQQVFYNQASTALYVVMRADASSGLAHPFAVQIFAVNDPPPCAATFSSAKTTVTKSGTVAQVGIKAPATCIYQASSDVDWIQLISGAYGSGNGTLRFIVRPNLGPQRTGDITLGGQIYTVTQPAASGHPNPLRLSYSVVGAGYSKSLDKVIAVVSNPNELHVLDAVSGSEAVVPLPKPPLFLSVSPDGLSAAVGLAGWISIVDLSNAKVTSNIQVFTDAHTVLLAGNGYVYAYPQNPAGSLFSTEIATGKIDLEYAYSNGRYPQLYADGSTFYTEDSKWDISHGPASLIRTAAAGTYAPFWLTEDGLRLIGSSGKAYTTSPVPALDLQYAGSFSNAPSIQWAAESSKWHSTAVIPARSVPSGMDADEYVQMYGDANFGFAGDLLLPAFTAGSSTYAGRGRFVFWNKGENKLVVLEQADPAAKLTADYSAVVYPVTTPQAGCTYSLGAESATFDKNGGSNTLSVTAAADCIWDTTASAAWITIDSGAVGFGSSVVAYSVAANTGTMSRVGALVAGGQHFTIVQGGSNSSGDFVNAVTPQSGSRLTQMFTAIYSDSTGAANLNSVTVTFGSSKAAKNSCTVSYDVATNQVSLLTDAGSGSTAAQPGAATALANSQCTLDMATMTVTSNGDTLTLNLPITFTAAFAGAKNIYLSSSDAGGNSGLVKEGTWTVP